jgi:hypothetical protein
MGDYEDRYPDAFGRGEEVVTRPPAPAQRTFFRFGLPRQVRDVEPAVAEARQDAPTVVNIADRAPGSVRPRRLEPHAERPRRALVARTPREICDDVHEQLEASALVDTSGISITVDGSEVTLGGTINSLFAVSVAQSLAANVPGVSRVQVQLRVQPVAHNYEVPALRRDEDVAVGPVYRIAAADI